MKITVDKKELDFMYLFITRLILNWYAFTEENAKQLRKDITKADKLYNKYGYNFINLSEFELSDKYK